MNAVNDQAAMTAGLVRRIASLERAVSRPPLSGGSDGYSFIQETTPTATAEGQTWLNTSDGLSYVWFDSFWVQVAPGGSITEPASDMITAHLLDPTPHPVYDDMASLTLIFENQIV